MIHAMFRSLHDPVCSIPLLPRLPLSLWLSAPRGRLCEHDTHHVPQGAALSFSAASFPRIHEEIKMRSLSLLVAAVPCACLGVQVGVPPPYDTAPRAGACEHTCPSWLARVRSRCCALRETRARSADPRAVLRTQGGARSPSAVQRLRGGTRCVLFLVTLCRRTVKPVSTSLVL